MARLSKREQYRLFVEKWRHAGPELERIRHEELRAYRYDPVDADSLLEMGDRYDGPPRLTSGLVEMQRLFMKAARQQGLLPGVQEESEAYDSARRKGKPTQPTRKRPNSTLRVFGNAGVPPGPKVALLCSVKCPGKLILDAYELAQRLRESEVTVVGGFHSPMEQECLRILLRSRNPVIWCLARGMIRRIPAKPVDCRAAVKEGRLIVVSPFPDAVRRATAKTAVARNRVVAEMADVVIVVYAAPGGKLAALCQEFLSAGKPLYAFDHPANSPLMQMGASPLDWGKLSAELRSEVPRGHRENKSREESEPRMNTNQRESR